MAQKIPQKQQASSIRTDVPSAIVNPVPVPFPVPTPYQSYSQGGSPYLKPGTTGQSLSQQDYPVASLVTGEILFASGKKIPADQVSITPVFASSVTPYKKESLSPEQFKQVSQTNVPSPPQQASYDPNTLSDLRHIRAQGANVGDVRKFGGVNWRWNGDRWEPVSQPVSQPGTPPPTYTKENLRGEAAKTLGVSPEEVPQKTLEDIFEKYKNTVRGAGEGLAADIEASARAIAEEEYKAVMSALGRQREEARALTAEQKESLRKQKEFTEKGLTEKEATEIAAIEKQKTEFQQDVEQIKEQLAKNWRDLSMHTQRILRARGVSDSSFASGQEKELLLNFNQGLRQIAVKSTAALADFSDAVIETNKFYTREKERLNLKYNDDIQSLDQWLRQQVTAIQEQEGMSLAQKFSAIKNATLQANQLKTQIETNIAEKRFALDSMLLQYQLQLKLAVATAAQGKVIDASKNIEMVKNIGAAMRSGLESGLISLVPSKDNKAYLKMPASLYGSLPNVMRRPGDDQYVYMESTRPEVTALMQAAGAVGTRQPDYPSVVLGTGIQGPTQVASHLYPWLDIGQTKTTGQSQAGGGVLGAIGSIINRVMGR